MRVDFLRGWSFLSAKVTPFLFCCLSIYGSGCPRYHCATTQKVVRLNLSDEVVTLDPQHAGGSVMQAQVLQGLFEGLFIWGADRQPIPATVEHWSQEENRVWTFHLRKDLRWSDGTPLTAEDFVRSWKRLCTPKNLSLHAEMLFLEKFPVQNAAAILNGEVPESELGLKALDDQTLQVTLSVPMSESDLLAVLCAELLVPTHPEYIDAVHSKQEQAHRRYISNGAFTLKTWYKGTKIELIKNPYYRNAAEVGVDGLVYTATRDMALKEMGFKNDQWDICEIRYGDALTLLHFIKLFSESFQHFRRERLLFGSYNLESPTCSDRRVRQALSLLLDKTLLVEQAFGPIDLPGNEPVDALVPAVTDNQTTYRPYYYRWSRTKRRSEAGKLLKAAGYNAHTPLKIKVIHSLGTEFSEILRQRAWVHPYLEVKVMHLDVPSRNQIIRQKNYDFTFIGQAFESFSASDMLCLFTRHSGKNTPNYGNAAYDGWVEQAVAWAGTAQQRERASRAAEKMLLDDFVVLPIAFWPAHFLVNPRLHPLIPVGPSGLIDCKQLRFK